MSEAADPSSGNPFSDGYPQRPSSRLQWGTLNAELGAVDLWSIQIPLLPYRAAAAVLASACLVCAAAPAGLTLSDDLPDHLADALLAHVTAKVEEGGATDVEGLGKPFVLMRNGTPIGAILPGRSTAVGSGDRVRTCFVALVEPGAQSVAVLSASRQGDLGSAGCQGYTALGLLPSRPGTVRLGILYDMVKLPLTFPVVLVWRDGHAPAVDTAGTAACGARHVTTIAAMRRPGCGRALALDRAFPLP